MKIGRFLDTLSGAGLNANILELREMMWLAEYLAPNASAIPAAQAAPAPAPVEQSATKPVPIEGAARPMSRPPLGQQLDSPIDSEGFEKLYSTSATGGGVGAKLVRLRGAPALPQALALGRALKPLSRKRKGSMRVVDERATAEHIAATGTRAVVMRQANERWFDIVVITETVPSLAAWAPMLDHFTRLLARQGGFRKVRALQFRVESEPEGDTITIREASGKVVASAGLQDRLARRIVLVASDCTSTAWRSGLCGRWLSQLAECLPVSVVQLLPQSMWPNTGIGFAELRAKSVGLACPTAQLKVRRPSWAKGEPGVVVPVFSLTPTSTAQWAKMVAGSGMGWATAALLSLERDPLARVGLIEEADATTRIALFRASATIDAQRLAAYFSVVRPLTAPVMRVIHQALEPNSDTVALAQVFLGGLLRQISSKGANRHPDQVEYDFYPGLRELFAALLTARQFIDVNTALHEFLEQRFGTPFDFFALLADVGGNERLPPAALPFAQFARASARKFVPGLAKVPTSSSVVATLSISSNHSVLAFQYSSPNGHFLMSQDISTSSEIVKELLKGGPDHIGRLRALVLPTGFLDAAGILDETDFTELRLDEETLKYPWELILAHPSRNRLPVASARGLTRRAQDVDSEMGRSLAPGAMVLHDGLSTETASIVAHLERHTTGAVSVVAYENSKWNALDQEIVGIWHVLAPINYTAAELLFASSPKLPDILFVCAPVDGNSAAFFLSRGIQAVVAPVYPVSAELLSIFAREFYACLLGGTPLIRAVRDARLACLRSDTASDAGAEFQCYGNPSWKATSIAEPRNKPISGADYSVYLIYSQQDDHDGWVRGFSNDLEILLAEAAQGKRIKIMSSYTTTASVALESASSAMDDCMAAVIIMSENFQRSRYCQHELDSFLQRSRQNNRHPAVFVADIEPVDYSQSHPALRDNKREAFWTGQRHKIKPNREKR